MCTQSFLKMALSKDERVDLVLLCGREGWSQRKIADEFHLRHPNRQINHSSVGRLFSKFKKTGSVLDQTKPGRNKVSDDVKERVLAKVAVSPKKSTHQWCVISRTPCREFIKLFAEILILTIGG